jgi:hypothetical protein
MQIAFEVWSSQDLPPQASCLKWKRRKREPGLSVDRYRRSQSRLAMPLRSVAYCTTVRLRTVGCWLYVVYVPLVSLCSVVTTLFRIPTISSAAIGVILRHHIIQMTQTLVSALVGWSVISLVLLLMVKKTSRGMKGKKTSMIFYILPSLLRFHKP